ncbi:bacterial extracellular solute-binding proteins, family 5 Middle [Longilinea arvoryzae]|uniref:Bacterial extracellular solute-binding proteins, family 5 Middle n=1 Tax=Longilinea arvoryzae TaxID=360412 RepID=A0A0S7BLA4_9CHLR|nr:ABC transporter substrate-binding protein [Longilinea arvoryzae]GAP15443.1 bacterial extracellular solute-binding proteins, family 5 Middle [Longilinea arvoryzae]
MKSRSLYALLVPFILSSLGLSSCQAVQSVQAQPNSGAFIAQSIVAPDCNNGNHIRAIHAVDRNTVTFELCAPDRTFPAKVGVPAFSIQDDVVLNQTQGDPEQISLIANGTGPFRITKTAEDSLFVGQWNNYWGIPVRLQLITFTWNSDAEIRRKNLSLRTADGISAVDPMDVGTILLDDFLKVEESPVINTVFLGMNNTLAPFDNLLFRQALATAIDRQKLADDLFGSSAQSADELVPVLFPTGHSNTSTGYVYNTEKAQETLSQSNFDLDQELVLSYDQTSSGLIPYPDKLAEELAQELKMIGVKVQLNPLPTQEFQQSLSEGKLGLYFMAFSPDYPDANSFFEPLFSQDNPMIGKTDPVVAGKIAAALATSDTTVIQENYDDINEWVKNQAPLIPLVYTNEAYAYRTAVDGILNGAFGESFAQMATTTKSLTFMQADKPGTLWPVDFSSEDTLRITRLVFDTLTSYDPAALLTQPSLADTWSSNADFTEWTFLLRYDVPFSDGKTLDANDVVATFAAQADRTSPNHRPDLNYDYYQRMFGNFMK